MYCPVCLDKSLHIRKSGKAFVSLNGKQMSTGIFLFSLEKQTPKELIKSLEQKIDEHFKWYSGFENIEPITRFEVYSSEFNCENGCAIPASSKISIIGILIDHTTYQKVLSRLAQKYSLILQLES